MDQHHLRVSEGATVAGSRGLAAGHCPIAVAGQIVWKDARGTTRIVPVRTRAIGDDTVSVECHGGGIPIPLFRLVHFQVDRNGRDHVELPECLRKSGVLCAVVRVGPCGRATGSPSDYELRLLIEPRSSASGRRASDADCTRSA